MAHGDRHVAAEADDAEAIDPGVVARLSAARIADVLHLWSGQLIERPALRALLTGCRRLRPRAALAPIEAGKMSARERDPVDAVGIDVSATRPKARRRRRRRCQRRLLG